MPTLPAQLIYNALHLHPEDSGGAGATSRAHSLRLESGGSGEPSALLVQYSSWAGRVHPCSEAVTQLQLCSIVAGRGFTIRHTGQCSAVQMK